LHSAISYTLVERFESLCGGLKNSLKNKGYLFEREPCWFTSQSGTRRTLPSPIASWLYERKSLTARLRRNCFHCFQVQVLAQSWRRPFAEEAKLLDLSPHRRALVREVRLECNGTPLIAARTVIPSETLYGARRRLSRLGARPLGEVIFSFPRLKRLDLMLTYLETNDWSSSAATDLGIQENVWGRRTLYSIGGPKLVVCEFFLPTVIGIDDARM